MATVTITVEIEGASVSPRCLELLGQLLNQGIEKYVIALEKLQEGVECETCVDDLVQFNEAALGQLRVLALTH